MKKTFSFLALIVLFNISYASFPVQSSYKIYTDTLQTEEIKKYHDHLIKMGIDLNSCKCESCRSDITPLINNERVKQTNNWKTIWLPIIITMLLLGIILVILLYRYVNKTSGAVGLG